MSRSIRTTLLLTVCTFACNRDQATPLDRGRLQAVVDKLNPAVEALRPAAATILGPRGDANTVVAACVGQEEKLRELRVVAERELGRQSVIGQKQVSIPWAIGTMTEQYWWTIGCIDDRQRAAALEHCRAECIEAWEVLARSIAVLKDEASEASVDLVPLYP